LRTASIQPQQSATSMASFGEMDGSPDAFLCSLIQTSLSRAWCAPSQFSKPAAVSKARTFCGST
jgi:hypothetical protein